MIKSTANKDSFIYSFQICIHFIFFLCLIVLAKISIVMVKRSIESGHFCLFPDLCGHSSSCSLLSMTLSVGFMWIFFIWLKKFSIPSLRVFFFFYHEWVLDFVKCFSAPIDVIMWFFLFSQLLWWITLIFKCWPRLACWDKLHLVMKYNSYTLLDLIC